MGLLKLKKWSYPLVLAMQGFWLLSGIVTVLSPTYPKLMQETLSQMRLPENMGLPLFCSSVATLFFVWPSFQCADRRHSPLLPAQFHGSSFRTGGNATGLVPL
jgi:hypothetical protein